jgi:4-hydroxy-3-polyprenylbenzoate decarboxylase
VVTEPRPRRFVVALTGASGAIYGVRLLERLRNTPDVEIDLVVTRNAERILAIETDHTAAAVRALAHRVHAPDDLAAPIASGSCRTDGMAVVPCSIKTLSAIANCHAADLVSRAADVTLKERRRLVLAVRETPLHAGHLRQMLAAAEAGAILAPPMPAFWDRPATIDQLVDLAVDRILDLLGVEIPDGRRWNGPG